MLDGFPSRPARAVGKETPTALMRRWLQAWAKAAPLDVPGLLDELGVQMKTQQAKFVVPCFDLLAAAPADPRVGRRCLSWLATGGSVRTATRALMKGLSLALWQHRDVRDAKSYAQLANTGSAFSWVRGSSYHGRFRQLDTLMQRKLSELQPLAPELRARLFELGRAAARVELPERRDRGGDGETLLQQLYADPADPARREVFRDWLLERGDPWGELIALQEHRAATAVLPVSARERSLLKLVRPRILGPLAGMRANTVDDLELQRGFLVAATVKIEGITRVTELMSRPELSTLERVTFTKDVALTPNLRVLKAARGLTVEALATAKKRAPNVQPEVVSLVGALGAAEAVAWWPGLRELHLVGESDLKAVLQWSLVKQLRTVGLQQAWANLALPLLDMELFERTPHNLQRVELELYSAFEVKLVFTRSEGGWKVGVFASPRAILSPGAVQFARIVGERLSGAREVTVDPALPLSLRAAFHDVSYP